MFFIHRLFIKIWFYLMILNMIIGWLEPKIHAFRHWLHAIPVSYWILAAIVTTAILAGIGRRVFKKSKTLTA